MAEALLAAGADVDARDIDQATPLHHAAFNQNPVAVAVLLAASADRMARDKAGATLLHRAISHDYSAVVEVLLAAGAAVEARDEGGQTPLHAAWSIGDPDVLEALLAGGADLEARDEAGRTPVYGAITSDIINDVFAAEVEEGHIGTFTTLMGAGPKTVPPLRRGTSRKKTRRIADPAGAVRLWTWVEADTEGAARRGALDECERSGGAACEVLNVYCVAASSAASAAAQQAQVATPEQETVFWQSIVDSTNPAELRAPPRDRPAGGRAQPPVRPATSLGHTTRCLGSSPGPPPLLRHWLCIFGRRTPEYLLSTPCRTADESAARAAPSLWRRMSFAASNLFRSSQAHRVNLLALASKTLP